MGPQSIPQAFWVPYHMDQFALFHLCGCGGWGVAGRHRHDFTLSWDYMLYVEMKSKRELITSPACKVYISYTSVHPGSQWGVVQIWSLTAWSPFIIWQKAFVLNKRNSHTGLQRHEAEENYEFSFLCELSWELFLSCPSKQGNVPLMKKTEEKAQRDVKVKDVEMESKCWSLLTATHPYHPHGWHAKLNEAEGRNPRRRACCGNALTKERNKWGPVTGSNLTACGEQMVFVLSPTALWTKKKTKKKARDRKTLNNACKGLSETKAQGMMHQRWQLW